MEIAYKSIMWHSFIIPDESKEEVLELLKSGTSLEEIGNFLEEKYDHYIDETSERDTEEILTPEDNEGFPTIVVEDWIKDVPGRIRIWQNSDKEDI